MPADISSASLIGHAECFGDSHVLIMNNNYKNRSNHSKNRSIYKWGVYNV